MSLSLHKQPPVLYGSGEQYPLFNRISIETSSNCNRRCGFCPISKGRRDFTTRMTDELYFSIIRQLYEAQWDGVIQLFLLNEPFIDPDFKRKCRLARQALPECTIYASTNADVVDFRGSKTVDYSIDKLMGFYEAGVTTINLNIYDSGEEQAKRYNQIVDTMLSRGLVQLNKHKYSKVNPRRRWITLTDMRLERLTASSVDMFYEKTDVDRVGVKAKDAYCARTQRHLVVRYDGIVPLCCATDPTSEEVPIIGDLNRQTILDVWNSEMFFKYRYYTQQGKRVLPACDSCNHRMAYSYFVRLVNASKQVKERWARGLEAYQQAGDQQPPALINISKTVNP